MSSRWMLHINTHRQAEHGSRGYPTIPKPRRLPSQISIRTPTVLARIPENVDESSLPSTSNQELKPDAALQSHHVVSLTRALPCSPFSTQTRVLGCSDHQKISFQFCAKQHKPAPLSSLQRVPEDTKNIADYPGVLLDGPGRS